MIGEKTERLQGKSSNPVLNQSRGVKFYRKQIYPKRSEHFHWKKQINIAFITEVACRGPK